MKAGPPFFPILSLIILQFWWMGTDASSVTHAYADVSGTWDLKVESPGGTATPSMTLAQEGENITGIYRGRMGESKLEGTIKGVEIAFAVNLNFQDQAVTIVYKGTVDKDSMKGTAQFGDRGAGNWTAKKRRD